MATLTDYQKQFLLNYFFKNEIYPGWRNIATKLLENGQCIVTGKECIWIGGIGNFIKTEDTKDAIDCILYKFDLNYFLTSEWYIEIKNNHKSILSNKKFEIEQELDEISKI